ncbi:hypothetical protein PR001_g15667 [Phytophthora rubi]|uniref:Uncharacterized protein n=1 Tax=Phytophthora rubi TaxID=129364 RepID=A0A6A3L8P6_9STRA|nr:hypothetical protein PR001_g15667 [Phytophthora rubi]
MLHETGYEFLNQVPEWHTLSELSSVPAPQMRLEIERIGNFIEAELMAWNTAVELTTSYVRPLSDSLLLASAQTAESQVGFPLDKDDDIVDEVTQLFLGAEVVLRLRLTGLGARGSVFRIQDESSGKRQLLSAGGVISKGRDSSESVSDTRRDFAKDWDAYVNIGRHSDERSCDSRDESAIFHEEYLKCEAAGTQLSEAQQNVDVDYWKQVVDLEKGAERYVAEAAEMRKADEIRAKCYLDALKKLQEAEVRAKQAELQRVRDERAAKIQAEYDVELLRLKEEHAQAQAAHEQAVAEREEKLRQLQSAQKQLNTQADSRIQMSHSTGLLNSARVPTEPLRVSTVNDDVLVKLDQLIDVVYHMVQANQRQAEPVEPRDKITTAQNSSPNKRTKSSARIPASASRRSSKACTSRSKMPDDNDWGSDSSSSSDSSQDELERKSGSAAQTKVSDVDEESLFLVGGIELDHVGLKIDASPAETVRLQPGRSVILSVKYHQAEPDKTVEWAGRGDQWVTQFIYGPGRKPKAVKVVNISDDVARITQHTVVACLVENEHFPQGKCFVRPWSRKYREWSALAYAAEPSTEYLRLEELVARQAELRGPPAVERPTYTWPKKLLLAKRPSKKDDVQSAGPEPKVSVYMVNTNPPAQPKSMLSQGRHTSIWPPLPPGDPLFMSTQPKLTTVTGVDEDSQSETDAADSIPTSDESELKVVSRMMAGGGITAQRAQRELKSVFNVEPLDFVADPVHRLRESFTRCMRLESNFSDEAATTVYFHEGAELLNDLGGDVSSELTWSDRAEGEAGIAKAETENDPASDESEPEVVSRVMTDECTTTHGAQKELAKVFKAKPVAFAAKPVSRLKESLGRCMRLEMELFDEAEATVYFYEGTKLLNGLRNELAVLLKQKDLSPKADLTTADIGETGVTTKAMEAQARAILEKHDNFLKDGNAVPAPARRVVGDFNVDDAKPVARRFRSIRPEHLRKAYDQLEKLFRRSG